MNRQELDALLVDYLYDELDPDTALRVEAALPDHPELMEEVQAHRSVRGMMSQLVDEPVPDGLLNGVIEEARVVAEAARADDGTLWDRLFGWVLQPVVAVAALFVLVGSLGWFMSLDTAKVSPTVVPGTVLAENAKSDQPGDLEGIGVAGNESMEMAAAASDEEAAPEIASAEAAEDNLRPVAEGVVASLVDPEENAQEDSGAEQNEEIAPTEEKLAVVSDKAPVVLAQRDVKADKGDQRLWKARKNRSKKAIPKAKQKVQPEQVADVRAHRSARPRAVLQEAYPVSAEAEDAPSVALAPSPEPSAAYRNSQDVNRMATAPEAPTRAPSKGKYGRGATEADSGRGGEDRFPACELSRRQFAACAKDARRSGVLCEQDCVKRTTACNATKESEASCRAKGQRCLSACAAHQQRECVVSEKALSMCEAKALAKREEERRRVPELQTELVSGDCDAGGVRSVVRRRSGAFRACFESAARLDPQIGGEVTASLKVGRGGKTRDVVLTVNPDSTDAMPNRVRSCLSGVMRRIEFQKPASGTCVVKIDLTYGVE